MGLNSTLASNEQNKISKNGRKPKSISPSIKVIVTGRLDQQPHSCAERAPGLQVEQHPVTYSGQLSECLGCFLPGDFDQGISMASTPPFLLWEWVKAKFRWRAQQSWLCSPDTAGQCACLRIKSTCALFLLRGFRCAGQSSARLAEALLSTPGLSSSLWGPHRQASSQGCPP